MRVSIGARIVADRPRLLAAFGTASGIEAGHGAGYGRGRAVRWLARGFSGLPDHSELDEPRTHDVSTDAEQPGSPELVLTRMLVSSDHHQLFDRAPESRSSFRIQGLQGAAQCFVRVERSGIGWQRLLEMVR